ncbi:MAG TPA: amidohydrolase family protein [Hyphomicrobiaceae bacterium]|nr:amidohydrolase family protein [Hyphomicrobiaceae bacterium]
MLDLIIRGGDVVTPQGVSRCDVAVAGEAIAAVTAAGTLPDSAAARTIDAAGKIVMPGGIDPHVHMRHPFLTPDRQTLLTQGPDRVGLAALWGGTTTLIDFAYVTDDKSVRAGIEARDADFAPKSPCDWAYHLMLASEPAPGKMGELAEAIQAGYPTIKIFTTNIWPHRTGRMVDFGDIWEVFKVLAREGGLGVIHAEDNDIVMHMYAKLIREGRVGFENLAEVHNALSEDLSFRRVLRLAESVPGTALYMMHVSAATGVAAIREARAKGLPVYGESLHQYMLHTAEDYKLPNGQIYHTYPSLKSAEDQKALWDGTLCGAINCVATDELCCTLREKTMGARIDDTTGGNSGVEPRLGVMYTEMVVRRGYPLSRYVDLVSTNAAKIMGLYPRKGAIAVGSDADITILDPARRGKVRKEDLHETDYTPWEGHDIYAWPVVTILRGQVVVEGGRYMGREGAGRYLKRKIAPEIIAGPML